MSLLLDSLRAVVRDLRACGCDWALVGGLAVSARAEPRTTRDVDVAVAVDDDRAAESLTTHLLSLGYVLEAAVEQTGTARLATVRLLPPDSGDHGAVIDLLFASCGIESEIVARAEDLELLPGLLVPVAQTSDLIAMKVLSRDDDNRPQDAGDLKQLIGVAEESDIALAFQAVDEIQSRGFDRGRRLQELLNSAITQWRR